jgi:hypothetical protein
MLVDLLLLACVLALAAAYVLELRRRWRKPPSAELERLLVRRRVIVNTTTGQAIDGIVWSADGEWVVLKSAKLLERAGPTPIDGEVVLDVRKVDFVQAIPVAEGAS